MKVNVITPNLSSLAAGDLFSIPNDPSVFMAVGVPEGGRRQAVRLNDGALNLFDASVGVQRYPEVTLTINI